MPVSIVVRMNSASNMIAKWYQYFISQSSARQAPSVKIRAMPTASVTAPPVRPRSDSRTLFSISTSSLARPGRRRRWSASIAFERLA